MLDSLAAVPLLGDGSRVVDVGSGVGLPGIPIAIARPDLSVYLVEPRSERVRWTRDVLDRLRVMNVAVLASRWASAPRLRYDVAVCRALAPPDRVVRVLQDGPPVERVILYSTVGAPHEGGVVGRSLTEIGFSSISSRPVSPEEDPDRARRFPR